MSTPISHLDRALAWLDFECERDYFGQQDAINLRNYIREAADEIVRLRAALRIAATAELYDLSNGIIDADVLEAVQDAARRALGEAKDE